MTGDIHPLAPHSLPPFVGAADGSDPLFSAIIFIVILAVLGCGRVLSQTARHTRAASTQAWQHPVSADHGSGVVGAVHA